MFNYFSLAGVAVGALAYYMFSKSTNETSHEQDPNYHPSPTEFFSNQTSQQNLSTPSSSTELKFSEINQSGYGHDFDYEVSDEEYTSEEEDERMFGKFKCRKCKRKWMSGNSWQNTPQQCQQCKIDVYPYDLQPLERIQDKDAEKIDRNKHHPTELCGKCKQLGYNCRFKSKQESYYY